MSEAKSLSILVVEDKPILAQDIIDRLSLFGFENVAGPYGYAEEALENFENDDPDIAILDIRLKGQMTGIDLARSISVIKPLPIIYLTSQEDDLTFESSAQTSPVAYLNKPFTNNELKMAVRNAIKLIGEEPELTTRSENDEILSDRIFVRNGKGRFKIKLEDILWIKSNGGDTSSIMTQDRLGMKDNMLPVVGFNLTGVMDRLSFHSYFVRASRYYIINIRAVDRILDHQSGNRTSAKKSVMIANTEIVLGDRYRKEVTDRFIQL